MSRGAMLIRSSSMRIFNLFLSIAISFYMMPYLVFHLGDRMYGLWTLVGSFLGYYGLLDLGLSSAIGRYISRAIGRNDHQEFKKVTSTAFYLFSGMAVVTIIVTLGIAFFLDKIVGNPVDLKLIRLLLLLLGFNFAFDFPVRAFNAVFGANVRDDISYGISSAKSLISTAFVIWAIEKGYGIIGLASVSVCFSMIDSIVRVTFAYSLSPEISIRPRYFDRAMVSELFGYSSYTFVGKIADMLRFQLDSLVITSFIDLNSVTHFYVAARLVDYLSNLINQSVGTLGSIFSQEEARNNFESIRVKFQLLTKVTLFASIFFGGVALLVGKAFIERWMGPAYVDSYPVLIILLIPYTLMLIQAPSIPLLYGISKHKFYTYANIGEGSLNLIISILLVKDYGIYGVALGTAIPMILFAIFIQPWYVCRAIQLDLGLYLKNLAKHLAFACFCLFLGWPLSLLLLKPDYFAIVLCAVIYAILYWPLILAFGFAREERLQILEAAGRAFPLFSKVAAKERS